ncbi:hypothetical protein D3C85_1576470 [compost metagenome]
MALEGYYPVAAAMQCIEDPSRVLEVDPQFDKVRILGLAWRYRSAPVRADDKGAPSLENGVRISRAHDDGYSPTVTSGFHAYGPVDHRVECACPFGWGFRVLLILDTFLQHV